MTHDSIDCATFSNLVVDDDPAERQRARRHAETCEACAAILVAHAMVASRVEHWKAEAPAPPTALEARILSAIREEKAARAHTTSAPAVSAPGSDAELPIRTIAETGSWLRPATWPRPVWAAAGALAATLAIGSLLVVRSVTFIGAPEQAERLLVADALRDARAAERDHAQAIARLEQATATILAAADDPDVPGNHAARLMSFRNRLRFLDETIAEIDAFLDGNPSHSGARTMLLAAYVDKTEVLREIIAFDQETNS